MPVSIDDVNKRWERIRANPECNLSLEPDLVAKFVNRKESELVQEKIEETLTHLANLRLKRGAFVSDEPSSQGDIVTCEGLESFLIPAVEQSLSFSKFLENYNSGTKFAAELLNDINQLLDTWENKGFEGRPYLDPDALIKELEPVTRNKTESLNTTESAAIACRVIIHLLHLHFNREDEKYFSQMIGKKLDITRLRECFSKSISFLVDAFQKGSDEKNPIGSVTIKGMPGSGWSWTNWQGLPPMLFFTAAAVDAFAELELYFIRKGKRNALGKVLTDIYNENEDALIDYQFCVDMARQWVVNLVLPNISTALGVHVEDDPANDLAIDFDEKPKGFELYKLDLKKIEELDKFPLVFYNNLYALLILLWSFGDWDDSASEKNIKAKSMIERSLLQVVNNYTRIDVIKDVLNRFPFVFYLPGEGYFQKKESTDARAYMDSGFLTLLARQLVLCGVYGLGDPNILNPLIETLYIELLLNRYREEGDYAYLWSIKNKEIFSTQRAIQALTFYYAYAKGKEVGLISTPTSPPTGRPPYSSTPGKTINLPLELRIPGNLDWNSIFTGMESSIGIWKDKNDEGKSEPSRMAVTARSFAEYIKKKKIKVAQAISEEQMDFLAEIDQVGNGINDNFHDGKISPEDTLTFLDELALLMRNPWTKDGAPLKKNLDKIKEKSKRLLPDKKE